MKIKERISGWAKPFAAFVQAWGPLLLNFLIVILGFLSAMSVFRVLAANVAESRKDVPKKDTVYVQLLNAGQYSAGKSNTTEAVRRDTGRTPVDSVPAKTLVPTGIRYRYLPGRPITEPLKEDASVLYTIGTDEDWWWIITLSAIGGFLLLYYIVYYYLPPYSLGMRRIIDPELLKKKFKENSEQIQSLGNPRKIKRFSNKVRFQYHYLEKKNMDKDHNIHVLFQLLLFFEKQNLLSPLEPEKVAQITGSPKGFIDFFHSRSIISTDEKFMRVMYALNKSSFF